jgi:Xaa-Pro aminopeptidase
LGQEVDGRARKIIAEAGYGDYFGHGLGHGVGLETHEQPVLNPRSKTVLQAGMVVTLEPGIYIPGWGGVRIEDMVLVAAGEAERLTTCDRDLKIIN